MAEPVQVGGENAKYRQHSVQVAKRALAREIGEGHVPSGYFVCCDTRERSGLYTPDIVGSYIYFNTAKSGWRLSRVVGVAEDAESKSLPHTIKMLDLGNWHVHRRTRSTKNYTPALA